MEIRLERMFDDAGDISKWVHWPSVVGIFTIVAMVGRISPHWKFIFPHSPWWGGWWERLIRPVKSAIRKTLSVKYVSRSELETLLHETEACVNSRPLTYVGDEPKSATPLSPSHFVIGRNASTHSKLDTKPSCISPQDLRNREHLRS